MKKALIVILFLGCNPAMAAELLITEIMYDAEGADTGREWLEVRNDSPSAIDLSSLAFNQAGKHGIQPISQPLLAPGEHVVISSSPDKFKIDYPSFSGLLAKSSFTLKNTGETISISRGESILDSVTYVTGDADGNGLSLQKTANGWTALVPSPGIVNSPAATGNGGEQSPATDEDNATTTENPASFVGQSVETEKKSVKKEEALRPAVGITGVKKATVGESITFAANVANVFPGFIRTGDFKWNFGDGTVSLGATTTHSYMHPGNYTVVIEANLGPLTLKNRIAILISAFGLEVIEQEPGQSGYIAIKNNGTEIDMSGWVIEGAKGAWNFPNNTVIGPKATVYFSALRTGFMLGIEDVLIRFISPFREFTIEKMLKKPLER